MKKFIQIPNVYKIFFPSYDKIIVNCSLENAFNKQLLNVHKLHEEYKNESNSNIVHKKHINKNNMLKNTNNVFRNNNLVKKNNSLKDIKKISVKNRNFL
jgi:hypothetical protein